MLQLHMQLPKQEEAGGGGEREAGERQWEKEKAGPERDSHGCRHIPHLPEAAGVKGILAKRTQDGNEHLQQEHGTHQEIHVLLQLSHLHIPCAVLTHVSHLAGTCLLPTCQDTSVLHSCMLDTHVADGNSQRHTLQDCMEHVLSASQIYIRTY